MVASYRHFEAVREQCLTAVEVIVANFHQMRGLTPEKRQAIVDRWCTQKGLTYRKLAKLEGVSVCAVFNAINKYAQDLTFHDKPKSGRKPGSTNKKLEQKICKEYSKKKEASVRDIARKLGTSIGTVQRTKQKFNLKTYRKQRQPKRSAKQASTVKTRVRKLYEAHFAGKKTCCIMDDETYVKLDYRTLPGPQFYTVPRGSVVSLEDRAVFTEKFGRKILVWQAICECGEKSTPFFTTSTMTMELYVKECLSKRLLPLVKKHDCETLFWPDLASCHYGSQAIQWYQKNSIVYVKKDTNPPNCPQLRPIERFWAVMKFRLRKSGKAADSLEKFKRDWNRVAKTVDKSIVQDLMHSMRSKVRKLARGR